jgi:hypothetical protein
MAATTLIVDRENEDGFSAPSKAVIGDGGKSIVVEDSAETMLERPTWWSSSMIRIVVDTFPSFDAMLEHVLRKSCRVRAVFLIDEELCSSNGLRQLLRQAGSPASGLSGCYEASKSVSGESLT